MMEVGLFDKMLVKLILLLTLGSSEPSSLNTKHMTPHLVAFRKFFIIFNGKNALHIRVACRQQNKEITKNFDPTLNVEQLVENPGN